MVSRASVLRKKLLRKMVFPSPFCGSSRANLWCRTSVDKPTFRKRQFYLQSVGNEQNSYIESAKLMYNLHNCRLYISFAHWPKILRATKFPGRVVVSRDLVQCTDDTAPTYRHLSVVFGVGPTPVSLARPHF